MAHRLAGAIEKFNRAKEQFDELRSEMDSFFNGEPKPYFSVGEFDPDAREWVERFHIREEPPLGFGVILGDCVHNLRSCLDHVVWQVTRLDGGTPTKDTQFPIASKSERQFESIAAQRIPGLSASHRALVKDVQPYQAGDRAHAHPLGVLATLSNTDKHQVINATYSFLDTDPQPILDGLVFQGPGQSPVVSFHMASRGTRLEDGTPWLCIRFAPGQEPSGKVEMEGNLTLGVAFGEVGLDAADFPRIAELVRNILEAFMRDFPETEYVEAG